MTSRLLLLFLTCVVTVPHLSGCFFPGSKPARSMPPNDKPPIITNVQSCRIIGGQYVASTSLNVGEQGTFRITVIDKNLDINKLFIWGYLPRESEEPTVEYGPFEIEPQEKRRTSFYLSEPITFEGDPGDWLFEVQIEDENGNLSNAYRFHVILH